MTPKQFLKWDRAGAKRVKWVAGGALALVFLLLVWMAIQSAITGYYLTH